MSKNRNKKLPYNWRTRVVEYLAAEGLQLTSQQVADLARYPMSNPEISIRVLEAKKRIQKNHEAAMRKLKNLQQA